MLDYYIIEQIKERQRIEQEGERPFLELPIPPPVVNKPKEETESKRVIIIDTVDIDPDDKFVVDL